MYNLHITVILASLLWSPIVGLADETHYLRRAEVPELECITLLKVTESNEEPEWHCQLLGRTAAADSKRGRILKLKNPEIIPQEIFSQFASGETLIKIPGAVVTGYEIFIPPGSVVRIEKIPVSNSCARRLQAVGDRKALVICVKAGRYHTSASTNVLSDEIFGTGGDFFTMSSQFGACSFGKFTVSALEALNQGDPPLPAPGVYEVRLRQWNPDRIVLREMITDQLNSDWENTTLPENLPGDLSEFTPFSHVLYCLPPESTVSTAYAFVNSWLTVFNDDWCIFPSATLHEIGHNVGLLHSGEGTNEYADTSGMMGYSYLEDDHPRMCFNAPKSFQLGWYSDKTEIVRPFDTLSWTGRLMGICDYDNPRTDAVIFKIETGIDIDYYLGFNRGAGINNETKEGGDQVLLTTQGGNGIDPSTSFLLAKLDQGDSFTIANSGGFFGYSVQIAVDSINLQPSDPDPAYAVIKITSQPDASIIYINCGSSSAYIDPDGNVWQTDAGIYDTGNVYSTTAEIHNTNKQEIYQVERYVPNAEASILYSFPLLSGFYDVHLHFAEIYLDQAGQRVFDIKVEGVVRFPNLDVLSEVGPNTALIKSVMNLEVSDGALNIELISIQQNAKINAVEIHPVTQATTSTSEATTTEATTTTTMLEVTTTSTTTPEPTAMSTTTSTTTMPEPTTTSATRTSTTTTPEAPVTTTTSEAMTTTTTSNTPEPTTTTTMPELTTTTTTPEPITTLTTTTTMMPEPTTTTMTTTTTEATITCADYVIASACRKAVEGCKWDMKSGTCFNK